MEERESIGTTPPPPYTEVPHQDYSVPSGSTLAPPRSSDKGNFPEEEQVLIHLRVLHGFFKLRQTISKRDGLYGLYNEDVTSCLPSAKETGYDLSSVQQDLLLKLEEKRWVIYVTRAVFRFSTWLTFLKSKYNCKPLTIGDMLSEKAFREAVTRSRDIEVFDKDNLPPPDILLIYHTFMLNPHLWMEECLRDGMMFLWHQDFPWAAIESSLDSTGATYNPGQEAVKNFENATKLKWANTAEPAAVTICCANWACRKDLTVLCIGGTDRPKIRSWAQRSLASRVAENFPVGFGFCDPGFQARCPKCMNYTQHELIRAMKFVDDYCKVGHTHAADHESQPLRGTIIDEDGLIKPVQGRTDPRLFPIHFLRAASKYRGQLPHIQSIHKLRVYIENELNDKLVVTEAINNGEFATKHNHIQRYISRDSRKTIRIMLSRYWNNSTPFGLDLVGAVLRQGSFAEKLETFDWNYDDSDQKPRISRFLQKYERFFSLLGSNPKNICVPTLDIDLVWHTHQLSCCKYYSYSVCKCGKFVDHDDKIATTKLHSAFTDTSALYQKMYKEPYSECLCWYCETVRTSHESLLKDIFRGPSSSQGQGSSQFDTGPAKRDPQKYSGAVDELPNHPGPHVSAHNAIHLSTGKNVPFSFLFRSRISKESGNLIQTAYDFAVEKMHRDIDAAYFRVCSRAKKAGRSPPPRPPNWCEFPLNPTLRNHHDQGIYPVDPVWADFTPHGNGNCVAPACGSNGESGMCGGGLTGGIDPSDCGG